MKMTLTKSLRLRAKTAKLRRLEKMLAWSARVNQYLYFRYSKNTTLTSAERRQRMRERSIAAREIENLRALLALKVSLHRFDIMVHNEGLGDRAETEAGAV